VNSDGVGIGTTANGVKLRVHGTIFSDGYSGDGSQLTNLANDSLYEAVGTGGTGITPLGNLNVGIGTTLPSGEFALQIGSPGIAGTNLYVANASRFIGTADFGDVIVSGKFTSTDYNLNSASGSIVAGIITATSMDVGTGSTIFTITPNGVGIGSAIPQASLDILSPARIQSYYEIAETVISSSGVVTLDLSKGQTFLNTTTENISKFVLSNTIPNSTSSFTLRIAQGVVARTVAINVFETSSGVSIPVYWSGGVAPIVTPAANKTDIYSFITFDGGASLYGVTGGQNFS
jgi:hypothetical protein